MCFYSNLQCVFTVTYNVFYSNLQCVFTVTYNVFFQKLTAYFFSTLRVFSKFIVINIATYMWFYGTRNIYNLFQSHSYYIKT
jgi:hypothetical protein